jgi:predicted DNA-binding protein
MKPPRHLSLRLPDETAALLHRLAYETGKSKHELVIDAIHNTHDKDKK